MSGNSQTEMGNNPYQSYGNNNRGSGSYQSQSQYPGGAMNQNQSGVARSDQYNSVGPSVVSPYSPNLSPHYSATTGMLAILSLVSLYEATQRTILYSNSGLPWSATGNYFPQAALLIAGIWEAIYSLMSLFIALWSLLFDWNSVLLTTLALGSQFVGWYTVVVFALAQPSMSAHYLSTEPGTTPAQNVNDYAYTTGALTNNEAKASYVFGWLFPLFSLDTALLAGLIFFTIQLIQIQMNNTNELHSPHYYARRLSFWSLLEGLYGISTIIYAAISLAEGVNHLGNPESPDYFYPNFTTYESITLITGILFTILCLLGWMGACCNNLHASNLYIGFSWLTFLWVVAAHIMAQCGVMTGNFNQAGFGLSELGLFFGVIMIGSYLAYKSATIETVHRGNYVANRGQGRAVV